VILELLDQGLDLGAGDSRLGSLKECTKAAANEVPAYPLVTC
jgi:hypothetical protein